MLSNSLAQLWNNRLEARYADRMNLTSPECVFASTRVIASQGERSPAPEDRGMSEPSSPAADEFRMAEAVGTPSRPHFGRDLWVFLLLILAGFAGALWILNRAWQQHEHVVEIGRAGGQAIYDWQLVEGELDPGRSPPWWTQAMARFPSGPDVLTRVVYVDLSEATDFERGFERVPGPEGPTRARSRQPRRHRSGPGEAPAAQTTREDPLDRCFGRRFRTRLSAGTEPAQGARDLAHDRHR